MRRSIAARFGLFLAAGMLCVNSSAAWACAAAAPDGFRVRIVNEEAVIVWDERTHTEQFVRRATFDTNTRDFGFLVPTPTAPTLKAVDNGLFARLEEFMKPEVRDVVRQHWDFTPFLFGGPAVMQTMRMRSMTKGAMPELAAAGAEPPVRVLQTAQVAGYDAVVLEADDPAALAAWLKEHDYAARPSLVDWLSPYVAAHWKITAFKFALPKPTPQEEAEALYYLRVTGSLPPPPGQHPLVFPHVAPSPVSLTFTTPHAFYPYREPTDQREEGGYLPGRSLRLFLLSGNRVQGTIGKTASAPAWPGETKWAAVLKPDQRAGLAPTLKRKEGDLPDNLWMTAMEDYSSPRPGTDEVFFASAKTQDAVLPPPILSYRDEQVWLPADMILFCLAGGGGLIWAALSRLRRPRSPRPAYR